MTMRWTRWDEGGWEAHVMDNIKTSDVWVQASCGCGGAVGHVLGPL